MNETEANAVRDALGLATGAPFELAKAGRARMFLREESVWEVACLDLAYASETVHLDKAWKDRNGTVWFETSDIADMTSLVEEICGSSSAAEMSGPELDKAPDQGFPPEEVTRFPRVVRLLEEWQMLILEIAGRNGVNMVLLYDGGAGLTTARIALGVPPEELVSKGARKVVDGVAKALREAYESVEELKAKY